jgi:hypothetical protein
MGQRTSVYLDDDLHTAIKASGIPLAELRASSPAPRPPHKYRSPRSRPTSTYAL